MMPKTVTNSKRRELARRLQRKSRKLDKLFDCINCSHSKTVRCKLRLDERVGFLECEKCKVTHTTSIHHLSHDVDVYHAWIDASEGQTTPSSSRVSSQPQETQGTSQQQKQQQQQRPQEWQERQEQRASLYAASSSTSYQYQQKTVEHSPQYQQQHTPYNPQYQQWVDVEEQEANPQYGAHQVDYDQRIHDYWNQGLGSRGRGAGARRG